MKNNSSRDVAPSSRRRTTVGGINPASLGTIGTDSAYLFLCYSGALEKTSNKKKLDFLSMRHPNQSVYRISLFNFSIFK